MKTFISTAFLLFSLSVFSQTSFYPWNNKILNSSATQASAQSDLIADPYGKIYFIGTDGLVRYYYQYNGIWQESALNYSAVKASLNSGLVRDEGGTVYYVGLDGLIYYLQYTGSGWANGAITYSASFIKARQDSKLAISFPGGYAKVHYTDINGLIRYIQWTNSGWSFGALNLTAVKAVANSGMITDVNGKLYYTGTDMKVRGYYWNGSSWSDGIICSYAPLARPNTRLVTDEYGKIYYIATTNLIHALYYDGTNWQENALNYSSTPAKTNTNFTYKKGQLFYQGSDNVMKVLFYSKCKWMEYNLSTGTVAVSPSSSLITGSDNNLYYVSNDPSFLNKINSLSPKFDSSNLYVYTQGKQLMYQGAEFNVKVLNYGVHLNKETRYGTNTYWVSPTKSYCAAERRCSNVPEEGIAKIKADFAKIKAAGYNSIRVTGLSAQGAPPLIIDEKKVPNLNDTKLYMKLLVDELIPNWNNPDGSHWGIAGVDEVLNTSILIPKIKEVLAAAKELNLKVILLTGFADGGIKNRHANYSDYLSTLAGSLNSDPTLMAYDLYNEPGIENWNFNQMNKSDVCVASSVWYNNIHNAAPKQMVTMGVGAGESIAGDVLLWDPAIISVDFLSFHLYSVAPNFTNKLNNLQANFKWIASTTDKPWIVGETGFSADLNEIGDDEGTIAEQNQYAQSTLDWTVKAGGAGYSWWDFHDQYGVEKNLGYMGIFNKKINTDNTEEDILKPVGNIIKDFIPSMSCSNTISAPSNYYNYFNYSHTYDIHGTVKDMNNNAIPNALIIGWSDGWANYFTYSKSDGSFSLSADATIEHLQISALKKESTPIFNFPFPSLDFKLANLSGCTPSNKKGDNTEVTGIENAISSNNFQIFPNPSQGIFTINVDLDKGFDKMEVSNIIGETIYKNEIHGNESILNLSGFPQGVYFIRIFSKENTLYKKVIKL